MRVLVCGGRYYRDMLRMEEVMYRIQCERGPFTVLINGCALGADKLAMQWAARHRRVFVEKFPADWVVYGPAAGPIRNQQMIDKGRPELVIAFPGGKGTADMVRRAKSANIEVIQID